MSARQLPEYLYHSGNCRIAKSNGSVRILIGISKMAVFAHAQYKLGRNSPMYVCTGWPKNGTGFFGKPRP